MVGVSILGIAFILSLGWLTNGGIDYIKKMTKK